MPCPYVVMKIWLGAGWFLMIALAIICSSMVLPVFGCATIKPRCPLPMGVKISIKIDPQALNPADTQLLEDMILTAANQALSQAKEIYNSEMSKITAGLSLPGFG